MTWAKARVVLGAAALVIGAGALMAPGARAQTTGESQADNSADGESVTGRPRAGYDAIGIDLFAGPNDPGSPFILYPSLDISGGYDDNVFREDSPREDDIFLKVSPQLVLQSDWVNHGLSLSARADIARWEEFEQNNATAFEVAATGFIDIALESQLFASASFARVSDPRDDVNNPGTTDLVHSWQNRQSVGFRTYFGDLVSITTASRHASNYVDNGANQDDRDMVTYEVAQRLGYEFQPGVVLYVEGGYNWRRYDDATDDFGYNRESEGWRVRGGLSYEITGVLFADVSAGYLRQTYEDSRFGHNSGVDVDGRLTWNPTDLMTVRAFAGTNVVDTTLEGASGAFTMHGGLGFDYDLDDNLLFTSEVVYTNVDYDPAPGFLRREDHIWQASAGLVWLLNEYFSIRADYTYTTRNSNLPGEDFNDNTVMLTLHSQL